MPTTRFNAPPGWPQPPQGWQPDPNWRPDPAWPPAPQGWQWWVADEASMWAPPTSLAAWPSQLSTSPPRNSTSRKWLTAAIVLAPVAVAMFLGGVVGVVMSGRTYPTDAAYEHSLSNASNAIGWVLMVCALVGYAYAAPKVSYRWFDTFFLLVPIYSIFWMIKIAYRLAYLPHKDWERRPEEVQPALAPAARWPTY